MPPKASVLKGCAVAPPLPLIEVYVCVHVGVSVSLTALPDVFKSVFPTHDVLELEHKLQVRVLLFIH